MKNYPEEQPAFVFEVVDIEVKQIRHDNCIKQNYPEQIAYKLVNYEAVCEEAGYRTENKRLY